MMFSQRHSPEPAEHGVRNRVVACRQRLRRMRAAQKEPGSLLRPDSLVAHELSINDPERPGDGELPGVARKANAD